MWQYYGAGKYKFGITTLLWYLKLTNITPMGQQTADYQVINPLVNQVNILKI